MDSVLVVYLYTSHKEYCRFLYPKVFDMLTYKNKTALFLDETRYKELRGLPNGEMRCAVGRNMGIMEARRKDVDWVLFMDLDLEPDPQTIEKLLAVKHGVVGALVAARGDPWQVIGHNYKDRKTLERIWLKPSDVDRNQEVDGISGASLMLARGVYNRVNYDGYVGPDTIPGRFTADDEYLQIKIYNSFKMKPKVASNCLQWHYDSNGRAFKLFGKIKIWRAF
jgi:hypothetical protein